MRRIAFPDSANGQLPGAKAATFRTIMITAKRYIPIVSPIATCVPQMHANQIARVRRCQMKNGYPISKMQMHAPATGKRYFHLTSISGAITLKGGRIKARHKLEPSHQPLPRDFVRPLKK